MSGAEAAVLGAAVGAAATVGVAIVQAVSHQRTEAEGRRERRETAAEQQRSTLVGRYLFELQDAVGSLDARLRNWADRGGAEHSERVDPGYWKISMLYALARALGAERILAMEGVYPQLESVAPGLGKFLQESGVERALGTCLGQRLFHYHRLALAESAIERHADGFRVVTYTEFRRRCEDVNWGLDQLLDTTFAALEPLKTSERQMEALRKLLAAVLARLEKDAGIAARA